MNNSELRLAIMQKRIEKGLTQEKLAEGLQVSQKSVSMWENGETVPREPMRLKMAQYFGLPLDYFLDTEKNLTDTDKGNKGKQVEATTEVDEVSQLAEALLNKYNDKNIDLLITKLKMNK